MEDIKSISRSLPAHYHTSREAMLVVSDMLRRSVKFILPNCAELLDPEHVSQAHMDLLKLPFPLVAFEIPWRKEKADTGQLNVNLSTKRIALCWEAEATPPELSKLNDILRIAPQGGVFVLPISWMDEHSLWTVAVGGCFVPYDNSLIDIDETRHTEASALSVDALREAGLLTKKARQFATEAFVLQFEAFEAAARQLGREQAYSNILSDTRDEAMALVQACAVLNCENVTTREIEAPAKLNKARVAKGKQPFFSYKVLALAVERAGSASAGEGTGSHASPRLHLRRGHLRRLPGKTIWVRASMVGAASGTGTVLKKYRLTT